MVLLNVDFHSDVLGHAVSMKVLLPQEASTQIGMGGSAGETYRTLLLLHGLSDDHTIWQRRTSIERYAAGYNMAVIMPNAERSYYTNMKTGDRYADHIFLEVPAVARSLFRGLSDRREDNFIAGLSMGGYGAAKGALLYPERFRAAACFSPHADLAITFSKHRDDPMFVNIFGPTDDFEGSENDIRVMAPRLARSGAPLPDFYISCGTSDSLITHSRSMRDMLRANGYNVEYGETEGAIHNWEFWDVEIQKALKFFDELSK